MNFPTPVTANMVWNEPGNHWNTPFSMVFAIVIHWGLPWWIIGLSDCPKRTTSDKGAITLVLLKFRDRGIEGG
jgi:hypothetical protein